MKTTLSRAMRYISSHRQAASGAALALAVILIFTLVSSPAVVGVSASRRSLPVYSVERDGKYAALTFDAAWGNEDTEQLIDILTHYGVRATFFVVGGWVDKYPESVRALADAGMEVMNHSNTHAHFASLSAAEWWRTSTPAATRSNPSPACAPRSSAAPTANTTTKPSTPSAAWA